MSYQKKSAVPLRPKTKGWAAKSGESNRYSVATPDTSASGSTAGLSGATASRQKKKTIQLTPPKTQTFVPTMMNGQPVRVKSRRETPAPLQGRRIPTGFNREEDRSSTSLNWQKSAVRPVLPTKISLSRVMQPSSSYAVQKSKTSQPHVLAAALHSNRVRQTCSFLTVLEEEDSSVSNMEKSSHLKEMEFKSNQTETRVPKEKSETLRHPRESTEKKSLSSTNGKDNINKMAVATSTPDKTEYGKFTYSNDGTARLVQEKNYEQLYKTRRCLTRKKSKVNRQFIVTIDKNEFEETIRLLKSIKGITRIEEVSPSGRRESKQNLIELKDLKRESNLPVISCHLVEENKMPTAPQNKAACKDEARSSNALLQVPSKVCRATHSSPSSASECSSDDSSPSEARPIRRSAACSTTNSSSVEEEQRFRRVLHKMF